MTIQIRTGDRLCVFDVYKVKIVRFSLHSIMTYKIILKTRTSDLFFFFFF